MARASWTCENTIGVKCMGPRQTLYYPLMCGGVMSRYGSDIYSSHTLQIRHTTHWLHSCLVFMGVEHSLRASRPSTFAAKKGSQELAVADTFCAGLFCMCASWHPFSYA
eukprot:scaffold238808_cov20-Prasinocladus_malaysianus.AAC.1